jgi:hypothetical protein
MAKDSEIKSTSKKKAVKKSTTAKKTAAKPKSAPKTKKVPAKKTETKKSASTTKRSTKKTKASTSTPKQKAAALKKKKVSMKDLLSKKFDAWAPEKPYRPEESASRAKDFDAPPYVTGKNEAEIERKRKLLFKTFDLGETLIEEPETGAIEAASPDSQIPPPPPVMPKGSDPMSTIIKLCMVGFVLLIAIILKVSAINQSHYYLKPTKAGVEIWQGIFAPLGEDRLILLPGAEKPEFIQAVYSKPEVYPLIFNYYVKKADELLEKPGMPDFEGIKINLDKALPYAATEKLRTVAKARRNNIDVMILFYKTEVAVSKETIPDYEAALEYLTEAQALDVDGSKTDLIKQKTKSINASLSKLKEAEETPIQN